MVFTDGIPNWSLTVGETILFDPNTAAMVCSASSVSMVTIGSAIVESLGTG
jgi:hypothetical protein